MDFHLGLHHALVEETTLIGDIGDAVDHQHGWQREARIALTKQFTLGAGYETRQIKARFALGGGLIHFFHVLQWLTAKPPHSDPATISTLE